MSYSKIKRAGKMGLSDAVGIEKEDLEAANTMTGMSKNASDGGTPGPAKKGTPSKRDKPTATPAQIHKGTSKARAQQPSADRPQAKITLSATFTVEPVLPVIDLWKRELKLEVAAVIAPYNQVFQELLDPTSRLASNQHGMNVILVRFEDWLRERHTSKTDFRLNAPDKDSSAHLEANLDLLKNALKSYSSRAAVPTLCMVCPNSPLLDNNRDWAAMFHRLKHALADALDEIHGIELLNLSDWHEAYAINTYSDSLRDEVGHIPFNNAYYAVLGTLIIRRYHNLTSKPYKVIVLDCDNTLWGGVCGEVGPAGLTLDGAFAALQAFMITCKDRGFILCLCSKNVEEDVYKVFDSRQDMILKREHLVDSRINWMPKSENLKSLAASLNLGLDSFIFIDDNPVECAEVRAGCPEVFTLQWPANQRDALNLLSHLWLFDRFAVTEEDRKRTDMYQANLERERQQQSSADFSAFLESLQLVVDIEPVSAETLPRVSQLTNRTNQFNLTTLHRSPEDIRKLLEKGTHLCTTIAVSDRFGSYGLVGVMIMEIAKGTLILDSFMLSCRVLGRGVEYRMLAEVGAQAVALGLKKTKIVYLETPKNAPARLFLEKVSADFPRKTTKKGFELTPDSVALAAVRFVAQKTEEPLVLDATTEKSGPPVIGDKRALEAALIRAATTLVGAKELAEALQSPTLEAPAQPRVESSVFKPDAHHLKSVVARVQEVFARALSMDTTQLDPNAPMETYVDDSFKNVDITVALETSFGNIPATILFEHRTLGSIASWLAERDGAERTPPPENERAGLEQDPANAERAEEPYRQPKLEGDGSGDIAVIGISARFPMAENIDVFWNNLLHGGCAISEVPPNRWHVAQYFDSEKNRPDKSYTKWGAFLDQIDRFDASFFQISAKEAELMDPQQRLFLEVVWGLLENAGYTRAAMPRKTGVFVGVIASDYATLTAEASLKGASAYRASDYYQIPNRVSYFFDFHGPSLAVDTACSASGTAVHLACESLRKGHCKTAVVGGVNLFLHPSRFVQYAQLHFLSEDDRIRPFGAEATGTVFGEGIAAILLKPLELALAEHDHIYGVIKASAINSGGRTNGFTVPNPVAQADLVSQALREARLDAGTISYIEAHGTGTPLGDPIEVRGLTMAFRDHTQRTDNQFCALGSVKSNLGHLESAAALSGIIKILLQMKHATLVPSLNAGQLNPKIHFEETPFYLQREVAEWKRPLEKDGQTLPLRAGISSFGAGGSNVHVILEEFVQQRQHFTRGEPRLIILSARNDEQLLARAAQLAEFLNDDMDLTQVAHTLQIGREAMTHRLATVSSSIVEMRETLTDFSMGKRTRKNLHLGSVKPTGEDHLINGEEGEAFVSQLIHKGNLTKLGRLWVSGVEIDWRRLYSVDTILKMALPSYPFQGDRFWIPDTDDATHARQGAGLVPTLHPLLDTNESTLDEQCFKKTFTGAEFVLSHHVFNNQKILPAVAYLEMARAAGNWSYRKSRVSRLKNIVWAKKFVQAGSDRNLYISLYPKGGEVAFEVSTTSEDSHRHIHAQGVLVYESRSRVTPIPAMDIRAIQARCWATLSHDACYERYEKYGFKYGVGFKPIRELHYNGEEVLAYLELPDEMLVEFSEYFMHPTLMDGALQSVIALDQDTAEEKTPLLPFGLGCVELFKPLTRCCYVYTRLLPDKSGHAHVRKYDIQLLDEQGRILLELKSYSMRAIPTSEQAAGGAPAKSPAELMYYRPIWEPAPLEINRISKRSLGTVLLFDLSDDLRKAFEDRMNRQQHSADTFVLVVPGHTFCDLGNNAFSIDPQDPSGYEQLVQELERRKMIPDKVLHTWSRDPFSSQAETFDALLARGVFSVFHLIQAFMKHTPKTGSLRKLHLTFVFRGGIDGVQPQFAGVAGLARTLCMENPNFHCKSVEIRQPTLDNSTTSWAPIIKTLERELQADIGTEVEILYENERRMRRSLSEFDPEAMQVESSPLRIREGGTFLITGGGGGLGLIFAEFLLRRYRAKVVLTGRSKTGPDLTALESLGGEVSYQACDVSNREQVRQLLAGIRSRYTRIHGIIHAAGVLRDSFFLKKTVAEMEAVFAPKVYGTVHLDEESSEDTLDFFVMFSSLTSIHGNLGQCDYAFANGFMDAYAERRAFLSQVGARSGRTLAINWPLWKDGGMTVDDASEKSLTQQMGMKALGKAAGIKAFEDGLACKETRFLVVEGYRAKVRSVLHLDHATLHQVTSVSRFEPIPLPEPQANPAPRPEPVAKLQEPISTIEDTNDGSDSPSLRSKTEEFLKRILSKETKLPVRQISAEAPLEDYGIDSVMILSLNAELEQVFGDLSKTLLFEYQTISELAGYFTENHAQKLLGLWGKPKPKPQAAEPVVEKVEQAPMFGRERFASLHDTDLSNKVDEDIAIIGISGRFPMADDLDAFWHNLIQGKDCIEEIPLERWNFADYFDEDKDKKGKTYSKWGGFIRDADKFDPLFFNISPREATMIDPQERIFLETAWHTFEDAGYTRKALKGREVGVYVGVMWGHYQLFGAEQIQSGNIITPDSNYASVANRVSYFFDFGGPSLTVDTMCSSSLTTIHLACESLHRGEIEMALAGGVNLTLHPFKYLLLSRDNFTSSDGRCRSFGEGGDGYVPGEGVGAVVLKPLSRALLDEDRIHGLIKGSAINHGGKTNGYTVPNPKAHSELVKKALERSGVDPRRLGYIEAHGTGTSLGDPIEIAGLTRALREHKLAAQALPIGSVKSNIGHLEAAAGIAGLAKILLQMRHGMLVPSIHSKVLNPHIKFEETPFHVNQELIPWTRPELEVDGIQRTYPLLASISSFGAGGSNAHLIIEHFPQGESAPVDSQESAPQVMVFSARNARALQAQVANMVTFLKDLEQPTTTTPTPIAYFINRLREELCDIAAKMLGVELADIDAEAELAELGFDPMLLNCLNERIQEKHGLTKISAFNYNSLQALAKGLVTDHPEAFMAETRQSAGSRPALSLRDMAFTLQTGREAMASRLAVVVASLTELREKLEAFLRKDRDIEALFVGTLKESEKAGFLNGGRAAEQFMLNLVEDREMERLAEMWATVTDLDWLLLYRDGKPKRIGLPLYPFERKRYWWDDHERITVTGHSPTLAAPTMTAPPASERSRQLPVGVEQEREQAFFLIDELLPHPSQVAATPPELESSKGRPALRTIAKALVAPRVGKVRLSALLGDHLAASPAISVDMAVHDPKPPRLPAVSLLSPPHAQVSTALAPDAQSLTTAAIKHQLRAVLAQVLLMDENTIDEQDPMADMGLDSILLVEVVKRINEDFGINIKTTLLYDHPTVVALSDYLFDLLNLPKLAAS